jgi:hypothetical protein
MLLAVLAGVSSVSAKRGAPEPVPPVVYKGVTYSAPNNNGMINYVLASDATGRELFRIKVFDMTIDPKLEEDVQWIFITNLKLSGSALLVKDGRGRCYAIDLDTKVSKRKFQCMF